MCEEVPYDIRLKPVTPRLVDLADRSSAELYGRSKTVVADTTY